MTTARIQKISHAALTEWVDRIIPAQPVVGIQAKGNHFDFAPLCRARDLRLDYDVSILPPKVFFQPTRETLVEYDPARGYSSVMPDGRFVLFGVHPYDAVSIGQMDAVFADTHRDAHYFARRKSATIVAVDVQSVSSDTFAGHMGTAHTEDGWDVLLTDIGGEYLVETKTKKGAEITDLLRQAPDADAASIQKRRDVWASNDRKLRKHDLKAAPERWPALLEKGYNHPVWAEKSERCFSCGSCNLLCPTCYCFDVCEEPDWSLQKSRRVRVWDGCMLADFAKVAGNHNFRAKRSERYRHRYYRKGLYVPSKIGGAMSCVGCGRCIQACVSHIANPVEIFNRLMEEK